MRKKTHEEFVKELEQLNPNIVVLGKYDGATTKIKCRCLIDSYEWETTPSILLGGSGCPKCGNNIKKTNIEFINEMQQINPNIEILGKYINCHTKIKCHCKIDDTLWESEPSKLLNGRGCPTCGKNRRIKSLTKNHNVFVEEMRIVNPNITIISQYIGTDNPIYVKCNIDGFEWKTTPYRLLQGHKCKECINREMRLSNDDFVIRVNQVSPNLQMLDKYFNSNTYIKYKCMDCGLIHKALPSNLLHGYGCPVCNKSKGEKECVNYFISNHIKYISQYMYEDLLGIGGQSLRFDFAIIGDNSNVLGLVEYDGIFHYKKQYDDDGFETTQIHDKRKNEYCKEHNISLLRIPYWEFDNVDEILDEFIKNISQPDCEGKNISC